MNALEIRNINKTFKDFKLKDINIVLPKGYILGFIGQNGAGKTTTINIIMDFIKKESGEVKVIGSTMAEDEISFKNTIGYVADECYFPYCINANDIAKTLKAFYDTFDENKFNEYMDKWSIPINKNLKEFSKGMKMKIMLAGVLSRETKILILDEPTSGLDPVFRDEFLSILQEYILDGEKSILFSTHIMSDVEKISDYIVFIHNGEIKLSGTKDDIIKDHMLIKGDISLADNAENILIGYKKSEVGFEGLIRANDINKITDNALKETPNLEDIIVYYTKGFLDDY